MDFLWVFLGGGAGCMIRYLIGLGFMKTALQFPVSTLLSNVTACVLFAAVLSLAEAKPGSAPALKLLLLTGFCGGLSTFSTFGYETFVLLKQNQHWWAFINVAVSLLLCTGSFFLIRK